MPLKDKVITQPITQKAPVLRVTQNNRQKLGLSPATRTYGHYTQAIWTLDRLLILSLGSTAVKCEEQGTELNLQ